MNTLDQEVKRIKSEWADIGCKTMFGKTCEEMVHEIISNALKKTKKK